MKNIAGKVASAGGASSLGLAMVQSFTAAGMKVVIADVEEATLEQARILFADTNAVICMQVDVSDRDAMASAREETLAAFGKVCRVQQRRGGPKREPCRYDLPGLDWVMKVNVDGVINGVVTFVNDMKSTVKDTSLTQRR